jgi:uncharacterized protein (UPF0179 family)
MFLHEGPLPECEACQVFAVCMRNLKAGHIYRVVEVREKTFPCSVHADGAQVVRVVEPELAVAIESRLAFPGGIITFAPPDCGRRACSAYPRCVPAGAANGDRCRVVTVDGEIECPVNRSLRLATLRRVAASEEPVGRAP